MTTGELPSSAKLKKCFVIAFLAGFALGLIVMLYLDYLGQQVISVSSYLRPEMSKSCLA